MVRKSTDCATLPWLSRHTFLSGRVQHRILMSFWGVFFLLAATAASLLMPSISGHSVYAASTIQHGRTSASPDSAVLTYKGNNQVLALSPTKQHSIPAM